MNEQDSEVLRWGFDILHDDPFSNCGYYGGITQHYASFYDSSYVREGNIGTTGYTAIENDEIIAHTLQEEFSRLAVAEATGPSHSDEEHLQASVLKQDWSGSSMRNYNSGKQMIRNFLFGCSFCLSFPIFLLCCLLLCLLFL